MRFAIGVTLTVNVVSKHLSPRDAGLGCSGFVHRILYERLTGGINLYNGTLSLVVSSCIKQISDGSLHFVGGVSSSVAGSGQVRSFALEDND